VPKIRRYICMCSREPRTKRAHFNVEEECENLFSRSRVCGFLLDLSGPGRGPLCLAAVMYCARRATVSEAGAVLVPNSSRSLLRELLLVSVTL